MNAGWILDPRDGEDVRGAGRQGGGFTSVIVDPARGLILGWFFVSRHRVVVLRQVRVLRLGRVAYLEETTASLALPAFLSQHLADSEAERRHSVRLADAAVRPAAVGHVDGVT